MLEKKNSGPAPRGSGSLDKYIRGKKKKRRITHCSERDKDWRNITIGRHSCEDGAEPGDIDRYRWCTVMTLQHCFTCLWFRRQLFTSYSQLQAEFRCFYEFLMTSSSSVKAVVGDILGWYIYHSSLWTQLCKQSIISEQDKRTIRQKTAFQTCHHWHQRD